MIAGYVLFNVPQYDLIAPILIPDVWILSSAAQIGRIYVDIRHMSAVTISYTGAVGNSDNIEQYFSIR